MRDKGNGDGEHKTGEEFLDIEIAMYFCRLIESMEGLQIQGILERMYEAAKKMENPYARTLLMDKLNQDVSVF